MTYLDDTFNAGGHLAQALEGYKRRDGQVLYAQQVDRAITGRLPILAEGPTGTGKSVGYLVPAIYHAITNRRRALVVTSNIALQEQLVTKDLPMLAEALPWRFTFALVKGRSNYLCLEKAEEEEAGRSGDLFGGKDLDEQRNAITTWAALTQTGDVSELPFEPNYQVWGRFSVGPDECHGSDCPFYDDCWANKALRRAADAHVIVTNYHLLFAHLQVMAKIGKSIVLPEYDVLILDEGHRAADIARDFFGFEIREGSFKWVAQRLDAKRKSWLEAQGNAYLAALGTYRRSPRYNKRLREANAIDSSAVVAALREAEGILHRQSEAEADQVARSELRKRSRRAGELAGWIEEATTLGNPDVVYYVDVDQRSGRVALCSKPIDVAPMLAERIFADTPTVIVTSATLTTDGTFSHVAAALGVPDRRLEVQAEAPFKWDEQCLLVLPKVADPTSPHFADEVATTLVRVVELARGRTLGLFTSYRNLGLAHERLAAAGLPYRVMRQGDLPRTTLVEEFKRDVSSVLLGTESFWQGVDVPGEALSCVVVDKLPFGQMDDPVLDAIKERDPGGWFANYYVPEAIIALRQGVGRLIRSEADYGVVVLLDARLTTKPYGARFLRSLPKMVKSRDLGVIRSFLDDTARARGQAVPDDAPAARDPEAPPPLGDLDIPF